jgi:radical SAM protein with 4Fe4S-binding SPASM domain
LGLDDSLRRYIRRSVKFPGFRLRDSRRFLTVRMDTTNICNLRCQMCPMLISDMDPSRNWHHIDPALFDRIAEQLFPIARTVGLSCGAEPFCNPDFHRYLSSLYHADVPVREVVTNGTLLSDENIGHLLSTPPTTLFVSIDGASRETHAAIRGGADLDAILDSLALLRQRRGRARFPMISFSTTLQKSNWHELPGIVEIAASSGARSVGVVPLVPYSGLDCTAETVDPDDVQVAESIRIAAVLAEQAGLIFEIARGPDSTATSGCGYISSWVYIDPDGMVNPCPYANTSSPIGDLGKESFQSIWSGEAYSSLRTQLEEGRTEGNCRICPEMRTASPGELDKV